MRLTNLLLLLFGSSLIFITCKPSKAELIPLKKNGTEIHYDKTTAPFYHGVASGDPLSDAVIIWTRVTPENNGPVEVRWEVATQRDFKNLVKTDLVKTDSKSDYTVKVDVKGLEANTKYYYRFHALNKISPVGETKTINNIDPEEIKLGVVSCSNYEWGYFSAYKHLSEKELDAVLHLGDYFYEYAPGKYGDTTIGRYNVPPREILSLDDYRTRYALYRTDPDLQQVHKKHPFIAIWDDHEITNNAYDSGAQNHQDDEGSYEERKSIAKQAYYEWLPIRDNASKTLYRKFSFGQLADIIMLDERLSRSKQADSLDQVDESYTMLGKTQLAWFKDQLSQESSTWKIIGNQVIFSPLDVSVLRPDNPANLDAWDGYAVERDGLINYLVDKEIDNVVFLTGDTHTSWAFDIPADKESYPNTKKSAAVEFGTTSITSANWNEGGRSDIEVLDSEQALISANQHLKFVNARDHGYMILTISASEVNADWYYVESLKDPKSAESLEKSISVARDKNKLNL